MKPIELIERLHNREYTEELKLLYGADEKALYPQRERYISAIRHFEEHFPSRDDIHIFSAPGRSEIGGNHTDHQHGCALAAAVNLDAVAVVAFREDGIIRLQSQGYGMSVVDLSDLSVHEEEKGSSIAIIRGIVARFARMGVKVGGFDAYTISDVLSGSGLSSSAAFETLLGTIIDVHYNDCKAGEIEIAKIGQYAENVYFGKGSGLLDQMVCSVGGFVFIDFNDTENPRVEKHDFDFEKAGYNLCITDTKGSHSDLTEDYVAVPAEMKSVAACFGKEYLSQVDDKAFFAAVPQLHGKVNDRAILRAIHFFGENSRAILRLTPWSAATSSASSPSTASPRRPLRTCSRTFTPPPSPPLRASRSPSPSAVWCSANTARYASTAAASPARSRRSYPSIRPQNTSGEWTRSSATEAATSCVSVPSAASKSSNRLFDSK